MKKCFFQLSLSQIYITWQHVCLLQSYANGCFDYHSNTTNGVPLFWEVDEISNRKVEELTEDKNEDEKDDENDAESSFRVREVLFHGTSSILAAACLLTEWLPF